MIQQSSATGYLILESFTQSHFDSQTNFRYEVENLYNFLKSFLQKEGFHLVGERRSREFSAWRCNLYADAKRRTQSHKGARWAIDHHSYPIVWFGKNRKFASLHQQYSIGAWTMESRNLA